MSEPLEFETSIQKVTAMQVPPHDEMVAAKDREEQMRAICGWLIDHVDLLYQGIAEITYSKNGIIRAAMPGHWIVITEEGDVLHVDDEAFKVVFKPKVEDIEVVEKEHITYIRTGGKWIEISNEDAVKYLEKNFPGWVKTAKEKLLEDN